MTRVTIIVPAAHVADANQLGRVLGQSAADDQTYGAAIYQDAQGARYAMASGIVGPSFIQTAAAPLTEPPWGADMDAARRAQSIVQVVTGPGEIEAGPGRILALVGWWPADALAALGLTISEGAEE